MVWKILDEEDFIIEDNDSSLYQMINLVYRINAIIQIDDVNDSDILDNVFLANVHNNLLHVDGKNIFQLIYFLISLQPSAHPIFYI